MPSTDAPNWWADVQQERDDLTGGRGRRPAEDWLGEDIDFVPRRRMARASRDTAAQAPSTRRADGAADSSTGTGAEHPLHGVFVPAAHAPVASSRTIELTTDAPAAASSRTIELTTEGPAAIVPATPADVAHELAHLSAADDPFATPPPPVGTRRTIQIKGRPGEASAPSRARRHRPRTASDRVGHRPDRIALWAVALGLILIILAATTSSSQAAVPHRAATAPSAFSAKVAAPAQHLQLRAPRAHR
ncbi:MAG: hypothetical protein QOF86_1001 [Baekduia sp.]|nr:hypothetical protein [Baekduia sp.]